jgi:uncharacterized protein (UPF0548 family)
VFSLLRPSDGVVQRFLQESADQPLSYAPVGLADAARDPAYDLDETIVRLGRGDACFARAQAALMQWKQFDLGWTEVFPRDAAVDPGTTVAVRIRHLSFWSLNGCRVVYGIERGPDAPRFGYAYGTLTNHAECGEELFEVSIDPSSGDVRYRIRAASRPRAPLARLGYPVVRRLQARFRRESARAMQRAAAGG